MMYLAPQKKGIYVLNAQINFNIRVLLDDMTDDMIILSPFLVRIQSTLENHSSFYSCQSIIIFLVA